MLPCVDPIALSMRAVKVVEDGANAPPLMLASSVWSAIAARLTVMEPAPLATRIPDPELMAAATGSTPADPIRIWPEDNRIGVIALAPSAIMIPCAVGLDTPVPPYVEFRRPPRVNVAEAPEVVRPVEPPTTFIFPERTVAVPESPVMVASDPEVVAKVPDVGKVTLVVPVNVNVAP